MGLLSEIVVRPHLPARAVNGGAVLPHQDDQGVVEAPPVQSGQRGPIRIGGVPGDSLGSWISDSMRGLGDLSAYRGDKNKADRSGGTMGGGGGGGSGPDHEQSAPMQGRQKSASSSETSSSEISLIP